MRVLPQVSSPRCQCWESKRSCPMNPETHSASITVKPRLRGKRTAAFLCYLIGGIGRLRRNCRRGESPLNIENNNRANERAGGGDGFPRLFYAGRAWPAAPQK